MKGLLVLENGARFEGDLLGNSRRNGRARIQYGHDRIPECFTDPSYEGQILTLTYPLIGNYGANDLFMQNRKPAAAGYVPIRSQSIRATGNARKRLRISLKDTMCHASTM